MNHLFFLAQTGWSSTDSANLQDLHDMFLALFAIDGFPAGLGAGFVFGAGMMVYRLMAKVSDEASE